MTHWEIKMWNFPLAPQGGGLYLLVRLVGIVVRKMGRKLSKGSHTLCPHSWNWGLLWPEVCLCGGGRGCQALLLLSSLPSHELLWS
jgi:hypothetical protein